MKGPIPKNPELLQRPKRTSTRAVLPAEGARRRAPPLPKHRSWHKRTREWWADVFSSPMRSEYLEVDVHGLLMLAVLMDMFWEKPGVKLAGEIRQQGAAFGLDPISRRRLQWSVAKLESRRKRTVPTPTGDARDVLRVVE